MKRIVCIAVGGFLAVALAGCASKTVESAGRPALSEAGPATGARIGVYDSRSVAVAFAGTARHEAALAPAVAAMNEAKAAADEAAITKAGESLRAAQDHMHRQGFGTAPVDDILALYAEEVNALKAQYSLTALISQWDEAALAELAGAAQYDATDALIDLIGPNEKQRRSAQSIREHAPLSDAELDKLGANE